MEAYDGHIPFAHFIKAFFAQHKKFGGRDRRQITQLCYSYFRLGKSYPQLSIFQKILRGLELVTDPTPEWRLIINEHSLPGESPDNIFPFKPYLSNKIDFAAFEQSHLVQPDLFLRIRPGYERDLAEKLKACGIPHRFINGAIGLPNNSSIEKEFILNREAVIQDLSSQRVGELLKSSGLSAANSPLAVWDCCAASGGKSILAKDILGDINLTVSDIRPSILANLKKRFREAGIESYRSVVADASKINPNQTFDLIIADVPCSGSGTWARTPEQLLYFDEKKITGYTALQSSILTNIIQYIRPGGYLLYITCSVFEKENEGQIQLLQELGLQVAQQNFFKGYENKADTMFAALLAR